MASKVMEMDYAEHIFLTKTLNIRARRRQGKGRAFTVGKEGPQLWQNKLSQSEINESFLPYMLLRPVLWWRMAPKHGVSANA